MPRRHRTLIPGAIALALATSACFGGGASPSASAEPSAPVSQPSATPGSSVTAPSAAPSEAAPTEFTCDLPIHLDATTAIANITDVRVATHEGFDRVVFEFAGGLPEVILERASPPFAHDASGEPIDVDGSSFLRLTLVGGTKQMPDGSSSYEGPRDFSTAFPTLVHLVEGGDFEARSTWYLGLSSEACVNVFTLNAEGDSGPRLVIDLEQ
jgi:hypothetical protein